MPYLARDPVRVIPGVGPKIEEELARMGIQTLRDLLHWFPRRYVNALEPALVNRVPYGETVAVKVTVQSLIQRSSRRGVSMLDVRCSDATGPLLARWFHQPYLKNKLQPGSQWVLIGVVKPFNGEAVMLNPILEAEPRILAIYSQTATVTSRMLGQFVDFALHHVEAGELAESLPASVKKEHGLASYRESLTYLHQPEQFSQINLARRRIAFEEVFWFFLRMRQAAAQVQEEAGIPIPCPVELLRDFTAKLPFTLTAGQKKAIWDAVQEMEQGHPMLRLLNGDVGAGKTVVAAALAAVIANSGYQTAFLVPTDILARQHRRNLDQLLSPLAIGVSAWTAAQKESTDSDVVVGTHALLQENARLNRLALVVIDEQHRFGVRQRQLLRQQQVRPPHVLSMTATPIPRTLALTLYGNLSVSVLREKPANRLPVDTTVIWPGSQDSNRLHHRILTEIQAGHQVFVICPLIKPTKSTDTADMAEEANLQLFTPGEKVKQEQRAVHAEVERLRKEHPEYGTVEAVHGKLKPAEKEAVMQRFQQNDIQVLVATSVIEVGIDIPNATVMVIEGAERFGLAQLHQFRGRVGRGGDQAYCFLCPTVRSQPIAERLNALAESDDGFAVAEKDLSLRGPGEMTGELQSGLPDFRMAKLTDVAFLQEMKGVVEEYVAKNPTVLQTSPEEAYSPVWGTLE
jgi:ATP-dependent DNA helicase RecG